MNDGSAFASQLARYLAGRTRLVLPTTVLSWLSLAAQASPDQERGGGIVERLPNE